MIVYTTYIIYYVNKNRRIYISVILARRESNIKHMSLKNLQYWHIHKTGNNARISFELMNTFITILGSVAVTADVNNIVAYTILGVNNILY